MTRPTGDFPFQDDHFHDECGVFGVFGHPGAGALTVLGLHALQHRGQEAAGIVTFDGNQFVAERHQGLVGDIFGNGGHTDKLVGSYAIGHNRYSTAGGSDARNIQPLFADLAGGAIALAHNGNLTNARALRARLVQAGAIFQSTSDTEVIIHLTARSMCNHVVDKLADALKLVEGAYSVVAMTAKKMIGVRDPHGVRPLVLGLLDGAYILASESCALDIIGAEFVRDIAPGEMVVVTKDGLESYFPFAQQKSRFCVFEYIYFARPDSTLEGVNVYDARQRIGEELAREKPVEADIVVPVPDSGLPAALGYSHASGLRFEMGIIRNHYVGRTFIEPTAGIRHFSVRRKHNPNRATLEGKRVVLIDDSIVRGTTSKKIVQMVRDAGAKEVHFRVACPPTRHSCFYGVDTPNEHELLAHDLGIDEMCKFIGADSLAFLSMEGMYRAMGQDLHDPDGVKFCDACFSGDYPIRLTDMEDGVDKEQLSFLAGVA